MIIRPQVTVRGLVKAWKDEDNPSKRKYATFKIYDRKIAAMLKHLADQTHYLTIFKKINYRGKFHLPF